MALTRRLEEDELALLEVWEDPVWFAEFLRSTADGSLQKEEWPKRPFTYRWYQRDLITDKTPYIALTAGRAVGKCNPPSSRLFTTEGWKTIQELKDKTSFGIFALNPRTNAFEQCRATISPNGKHTTYRVKSKSGFSFEGTANHPVLTERGYIPIEELDVENDKIAVVTKLPHIHQQSYLKWFELRWLGYILGNRRRGVNNPMRMKYHRQVAEMEAIAKYFDANFHLDEDGKTVTLERKMGYKAYGTILAEEIGWKSVHRNAVRSIPDAIKKHKLEDIKIFFEAYASQYGEFTKDRIYFNTRWPKISQDVQELLLYFGIESRIDSVDSEEFKERRWFVEIVDYHAYYQFFQTFKLPGISVRDLPEPGHREQPSEWYRFENIDTIEQAYSSIVTYAVTVWEHHNYICDYIIVHNSLVLEDKIIWESVNTDLAFKETKEQTLLTANVSQMTPILDRLTQRFMSSKILKDFLQGQMNRSKGTFDFPLDSSNYRLNARIAGQRGEANMVGLHVNKVKIDECQLFPMAAYTQMLPSINTWEEGSGAFLCGVPTGLREGNVLYLVDQVSSKYKKYRVPAHNNPFFTMRDNIESLKQFGGADSEDYIHLVLGKHGSPAFSVIPREDIKLEPFDFYTYRFNATDKQAGKNFRQALGTPKIEQKLAKFLLFAIDTGFADPTVIQVFGYGEDGVWRTLIRYRLTRIPFPEQIQIIDWLNDVYDPVKIGIDMGAGGGGMTIVQDLLTDKYPKAKGYERKISGVNFSDRVSIGENSDGTSIDLVIKSYGGQQLAKMVSEQELVFSELDMEGVSQLERVAYQRSPDGATRYFVLSERGQGASKDDHIFASYVVFTACLLTMTLYKPRKRLFGARWI